MPRNRMGTPRFFSCRLVVVAWLIAMAAGCGGDPPATTPTKPPGGVAVMEGRFSIDGKPLRVPCRTDDLIAVIGAPARHEIYEAQPKQPPVRVHVWDELGMYAFETPDNKTIIQISFVLDRRGKTLGPSDLDRVWPKKDYASPVNLEGADITKSSTTKRINADIQRGQLMPEEKFPFVWSVAAGAVTARVVTQNEGASVLEFSLSR